MKEDDEAGDCEESSLWMWGEILEGETIENFLNYKGNYNMVSTRKR